MSRVRNVHTDTFWFELVLHFAPVIDETDWDAQLLLQLKKGTYHYYHTLNVNVDLFFFSLVSVVCFHVYIKKINRDTQTSRRRTPMMRSGAPPRLFALWLLSLLRFIRDTHINTLIQTGLSQLAFRLQLKWVQRSCVCTRFNGVCGVVLTVPLQLSDLNVHQNLFTMRLEVFRHRVWNKEGNEQKVHQLSESAGCTSCRYRLKSGHKSLSPDLIGIFFSSADMRGKMNRKDDGLLNINACELLTVHNFGPFLWVFHFRNKHQLHHLGLQGALQTLSSAEQNWTAHGQVLVRAGQRGSPEPVLPLSLLVDETMASIWKS